ncbi:GCN5-related N-acetyltransferase [Paraglaciecola sp. T6c]|uniref:GNAT family N-acetyltransferase/peptidase C39 family protein n=1 Tax=Pseudoalteromonas atlantica (strain T6c / ATCC BAA-1087) TaxID=3042615 RepID=UPI00005C541A|nr:GNAT family N-acetyltransferase/peptidase C39 family protein [Paraglaciecola sp. T6c]ABG42656.1 GCN5-related N-acetyltransferase [Paraglaciecola sp. T6c]
MSLGHKIQQQSSTENAVAEDNNPTLSSVNTVSIRNARVNDIAQLVELENASFQSDRLSQRRFMHWLKATDSHRVFMVATDGENVLAYGLVIMRKGTRLARLYSIAVSITAQGMGVGRKLLLALEQQTLEQDKLFMRLEVATNNIGAIKLYESLGYRSFGTYANYYEGSIDALRMQKPIRQSLSLQTLPEYPWYQQTTEFTCGPSSLMMAMANLNGELDMSQSLELDIWRQATTIFMTSGHGGCHPIGLALAAHSLGFEVTAYVNTKAPLFIDGVRSEHKKYIMQAVDRQFLQRAEAQGIKMIYTDPDVKALQKGLSKGAAVISLISTYQLDGKKIPHWVTVTHIDEDCLYLHDPDPDDLHPQPMDCQHIPIAREDFFSMSAFGKSKLRTALLITKK